MNPHSVTSENHGLDGPDHEPGHGGAAVGLQASCVTAPFGLADLPRLAALGGDDEELRQLTLKRNERQVLALRTPAHGIAAIRLAAKDFVGARCLDW